MALQQEPKNEEVGGHILWILEYVAFHVKPCVTRESAGVILADLDHFKRINDTYGHLAGDVVLEEAVRRMTNLLRPSDTLGRYGGEEFLIVVPECTTADLITLAERLRQGIAAAPVTTFAGTIPFTISLGAVATDNVPPIESTLLQLADEALYQAKRKAATAWGPCQSCPSLSDAISNPQNTDLD